MGQPQRPAGRGGNEAAAVIDGEDGRQGMFGGIGGDAGRGLVGRGEGQRQRLRPLVGQFRRQVEAGGHRDAQPFGRGAERLHSVGAHGRQEHEARRVGNHAGHYNTGAGRQIGRG